MNANTHPSRQELDARMHAFRELMSLSVPSWRTCLIVSKVNMYYLTGTMQDGCLFIPRDDDAVLWVRRSYERAVSESALPDIRPMNSYRDMASHHTDHSGILCVETEVIPVAMLERIRKYLPFEAVKPLDGVISRVRAVKSPYELDLLRHSGDMHRRVFEDFLPGQLREGITELEFAATLYLQMIREGHHGTARFAMFDVEVGIGHICFGDNSLLPTSFNGPGGHSGISASAPIWGSQRKLASRELIFTDIGCGYNGYHTDKSTVYYFGGVAPKKAADYHRQCVYIQDEIASMLVPDAVPSEIYKKIMGSLSSDFLEHFMGYGARRVKFLGHGIGLHIDEYPVIAEGFDEPLQENMVIALEPKRGIPEMGMVGIENTFIVTPKGGECITGMGARTL